MYTISSQERTTFVPGLGFLFFIFIEI